MNVERQDLGLNSAPKKGRDQDCLGSNSPTSSPQHPDLGQEFNSNLDLLGNGSHLLLAFIIKNVVLSMFSAILRHNTSHKYQGLFTAHSALNVMFLATPQYVGVSECGAGGTRSMT